MTYGCSIEEARLIVAIVSGFLFTVFGLAVIAFIANIVHCAQERRARRKAKRVVDAYTQRKPRYKERRYGRYIERNARN